MPMNRLARFSKLFASLGVVAGMGLCASPQAAAQEVVVSPDDAYIATAEPVYYNGAAHYWYRDRWYYRTGITAASPDTFTTTASAPGREACITRATTTPQATAVVTTGVTTAGKLLSALVLVAVEDAALRCGVFFDLG
jgi:hypothetical protein